MILQVLFTISILIVVHFRSTVLVVGVVHGSFPMYFHFIFLMHQKLLVSQSVPAIHRNENISMVEVQLIAA